MMKQAVKVKRAIRSILPRPIVVRYDDFMDRLHLEQLPQKIFDAGNVRCLVSRDLSRFFSDPEIFAAWEEDHAAIARFYHDKELFLGVNPGDRRAIYFLIMGLKPRNVLEIGTHIGASTISIAAALRRLNEGGNLTTIDIVDVNHPEHGPWNKAGMSKSPANCAWEISSTDQIHFHTGPSLKFMRETNQRFDFIFLDGEHAGRTVYEELSAALPLLQKDGVILLHDYYPEVKPLFPNGVIIPGPFRAMARIYKENPVIEVLPLGVLPWPTKLGTNVTSLALVVKRLAEVS